MKDKKKIILSVLCVLSMILIAFGVTYSIFTYTKLGNTENTITTGKLTFLYTENTGTGTGINITDAFPVSDEIGKAYISDNQVFDFKVESEIVGNNEIPYEVTVAKTDSSTLSEEYVKIYLTDTTELEETDLLEPTLYSDLPTSSTKENEKQIYFDIVEANEDYEKDFRLRMWIAEGSDQEAINDKSFTVKVGVYSPAEKMEVQKKYTIVNDTNSNGETDIGDEIAIGDEHFYIISNDGTTINALAKYNLNVGGEYNGSTWVEYTEPTGIQDSSNKGFVEDSTIWKGVTQFDSVARFMLTYNINYTGSIVEGYVNDYVTYLNTNNPGLNVTGRLMQKEDIKSLLQFTDEQVVNDTNIKNKVVEKECQWLITSTYWIEFSRSSSTVLVISNDGYLVHMPFNNYNAGVRPVITIAA